MTIWVDLSQERLHALIVQCLLRCLIEKTNCMLELVCSVPYAANCRSGVDASRALGRQHCLPLPSTKMALLLLSSCQRHQRHHFPQLTSPFTLQTPRIRYMGSR